MNTIPQGYKQNAAGHLVPESTIADIDRARDDLVNEIVQKSQALSQALSDLKINIMGDIAAFVELSAEKYNAQLGGKKGNLSLMSFSGQYKIQRSVAENLVFDERLQIAKQLIDECVRDWAKDSNDKTKALIEHAFQTDKAGKISTARVFGLLRLDIEDEQWQNAMAAIRDSIQVAGSKTYVRIYQRVGDSDEYQQINLDLASA